MAKTKVLISVDPQDLLLIDQHAIAAGMSRSEYMVTMARLSNPAPLLDSIYQLQRELAAFAYKLKS